MKPDFPGRQKNDIIASGDNIQQEIDNCEFALDMFHALNKHYLEIKDLNYTTILLSKSNY